MRTERVKKKTTTKNSTLSQKIKHEIRRTHKVRFCHHIVLAQRTHTYLLCTRNVDITLHYYNMCTYTYNLTFTHGVKVYYNCPVVQLALMLTEL